jgi:hypothetical protein
VHEAAADDETILRISMDAKATVKIGPFSRNGKSRTPVKAADHDFKAEATITPFGIYLPDFGELFLYMTTSKLTSDFIVDALDAFWAAVRNRFPKVTTLLINADNGPESHSRRTQLMHRFVTFADQQQLTLQLAYYPPYHSKYNPVERVWGGLEQHWNGSLLDSIQTVLAFARTFSWQTRKPLVTLVERLYNTGAKLTHKAMTQLEQRFQRLNGLEKWFVTISPLLAT